MAENEKLIEQRCCELLKARGMTFAAAESCTGGLIAKRITDVPGASLVFMGGVVSYTDTVKHRVLGVPAEMLEEYGAVSAPVARAMAEGARRATTADLAVSVTGVAGPERDEKKHWTIACCAVGGADAFGVRLRRKAGNAGRRTG